MMGTTTSSSLASPVMFDPPNQLTIITSPDSWSSTAGNKVQQSKSTNNQTKAAAFQWVVQSKNSPQFCELLNALPSESIVLHNFHIIVPDEAVCHETGVGAAGHAVVSINSSSYASQSVLNAALDALPDKVMLTVKGSIGALDHRAARLSNVDVEFTVELLPPNVPSVLTSMPDGFVGHTRAVSVLDSSVQFHFQFSVIPDMTTCLHASLPMVESTVRTNRLPCLRFSANQPMAYAKFDWETLVTSHDAHVSEDHRKGNSENSPNVISDHFRQGSCILTGLVVDYIPKAHFYFVARPVVEQAQSLALLSPGFIVKDLKLQLYLPSDCPGILWHEVEMFGVAQAKFVDEHQKEHSLMARVQIASSPDASFMNYYFKADALTLFRFFDLFRTLADDNNSHKHWSLEKVLQQSTSSFFVLPAEPNISQFMPGQWAESRSFLQGGLQAGASHLTWNGLFTEYNDESVSQCFKVSVSNGHGSRSKSGMLEVDVQWAPSSAPHGRYPNGVMACADFMRFVGCGELTEQVPPTVLSSVRLNKAKVTIVVCAKTSSIFALSGHGEMPANVGQISAFRMVDSPQLQTDFSFRYRVREAAFTARSRIPQSVDTADAIACMSVRGSSTVEWFDSRTRSLIEDQCMHPIIDYVLCQKAKQLCTNPGSVYETINAFYVLQPHLPSGMLTIPVTPAILSCLPEQTIPVEHSDDYSVLSAGANTAIWQQLVQLASGSPFLWFACLDYLDINSIIFGLVPALHSVPVLLKNTCTGSIYWQKRLSNEYGNVSDISLCTASVLDDFRVQYFQRRRALCDDNGKIGKDRLQQIDCQQQLAYRYCSHYNAAVEYQHRLNTFSTEIMQQPRHRVIPQCFDGTLERLQSAISIPRAAVRLLLCTPPFQPPINKPNQRKDPILVYNSRDLSKSMDWAEECIGRINIPFPTLQVPHFLVFMAALSEYCALWSMYTGPLYVFEDTTNSHLGIPVDKTNCSLALQEKWNQSSQLGVRMVPGSSDSNQWPITRHYHAGTRADAWISIVDPNLDTFFENCGVSKAIRATRSNWQQQLHGQLKKRGFGGEKDRDDHNTEDDDAFSVPADSLYKSNIFVGLTEDLLEVWYSTTRPGPDD